MLYEVITPGRVVALPGDAVAAVEFASPKGYGKGRGYLARPAAATGKLSYNFV